MAKKTSKSFRTQSNRRRIAIISLAGVAAVAFLALLGYAAWAAMQPEPILGEEIPIAGAEHIPEGQTATDHNSDPPTSGQHYAQPAEAGFYEEAPPDERLVHNLEHGHIVVYYNCSGLSDTACEELQDGIREAMEAAGVVPSTRTLKIVAVPRPGMENMITYTSWGKLYRAETFNREDFILFVKQNRNRAPEPLAP
jgi:hypothetical protein